MPTNTVKDHTGQEFPSERAMCRAWGIPHKLYTGRKYAGWSLERALTTPAMHASHKGPDGKDYPSMKAMCRAYGIGTETFKKNLEQGMCLEDALSVKKSQGLPEAKPCRDHTGQEFPSERAMCRAWGISTFKFRRRLDRHGMSIKEALTADTSVRGPGGKTYRSMEELYRAEGVRGSSVRHYMSKGMDLEDAVRASRQSAIDRDTPVMYGGKAYPNATEACRAAGLSPATYIQRMRAGWDQEAALSTPPKKGGTRVSAFDKEYPSIQAMCNAFRLSVPVMNHHRKRHPDFEDALMAACSIRWPGTDAKGLRIMESLGGPWFLCEERGTDGCGAGPYGGTVVMHMSALAEDLDI